MDAEKSLEKTELFTEQSYEGRHFAGVSCQDAVLKDIEFFQCRFDGCQFDPTKNRLKKAVFSLPEAVSLLSAFDIVLK